MKPDMKLKLTSSSAILLLMTSTWMVAQERKPDGKGGTKGSDADSPVIVADTSTIPDQNKVKKGGTKTAAFVMSHEVGQRVRLGGGGLYVAEKGYRAACLESVGVNKYPLNTKGWFINFGGAVVVSLYSDTDVLSLTVPNSVADSNPFKFAMDLLRGDVDIPSDMGTPQLYQQVSPGNWQPVKVDPSTQPPDTPHYVVHYCSGGSCGNDSTGKPVCP